MVAAPGTDEKGPAAEGEKMGLISRIKSEYAYLKGALTVLRKITPIAKNSKKS